MKDVEMCSDCGHEMVVHTDKFNGMVMNIYTCNACGKEAVKVEDFIKSKQKQLKEVD